jgi:glycosyltransferase involved in cell wall biosynthesis
MKDHASFLHAVEGLPHVRAILIGLGTDRLTLPPNVRALGVCDEVERLYAAADLVVSSSAYGEGFSNIIAEGMSTGLIPVATDVGDARAIIGDIGRVVPPRDAGALARALQDMIMLSRYVREDLGQRARHRITTKFSIEDAVSRFERVYLDS